MQISNEKIRTILASVLKISEDELPLDASMDMIETWDSLRQLTFILVLEDELEIEIPDSNVQFLTSIPAVVEWLAIDE
jgi:acyl carrier protein